jgi:hypothetical protein
MGAVIMDLQLLGTSGVIGMDDFVLDSTDSFAFKNPDIKTGYFHRTGMATRKDVTFVPTPSNTAAEVAMIQTFAEVAAFGNASKGWVCRLVAQDTAIPGCHLGGGRLLIYLRRAFTSTVPLT